MGFSGRMVGNSLELGIKMSIGRSSAPGSQAVAGNRPSKPFALGWQLGDLMIVIVVCAFLFSAVARTGWGAVGLLAILMIPPLFIAAIVTSFQKIGVRRDAFLSTLASAVRRGVPLPRAIEVLADLGGFGSTSRLRSLARRLDEGVPLPAALRMSNGLVSRDTLTLIQTGQQTGRLAEAIEIADETRVAHSPGRVLFIGKILYFLNIIMLLQYIILNLLGHTQLTLRILADDLDAKFPTYSIKIINWSFLLSKFMKPKATILVDVLVVGVGAILIVFADRLPLIRMLSRAKHSALIMRTFSFFIEADRPATEAFGSLLETLPRGWVFNAVSRAYERTTSGEDWIKCLHRVNLIRSVDASALEAARRVGNLGWALRELARRAERRHLDRVGRRLQLLHSVGVVFLGGIVLVVVVGFFAPLIYVIDKLSLP